VGAFYFPEYFIFVDFFPNLFNKSGKNPNGSEGLKHARTAVDDSEIYKRLCANRFAA